MLMTVNPHVAAIPLEQGNLMTITVSRRVSASALALVATAALGIGGSTEAWGATSTWNSHHHTSPATTNATSTWNAHSGGHVTLAGAVNDLRTSTWESRTSAWE
jgi:hypothetical protein